MNSTPSMTWRARGDLFSKPWRGRVRDYDLFKEVTIGFLVVATLTLVLAAVFGSPDEPGVTFASWSAHDPVDFATTATAELAGTSDTAQYGPPYNSTADATQTLGPLDLQSLSGVRIPIDTANAFVIAPLKTLVPVPPEVAQWTDATNAQKTAWTDAYTKALAADKGSTLPDPAAGDYGPVPGLITALTGMARSGALDGALSSQSGFYELNYTPAILFLGDGQYFQNLAAEQHLTGDQWGMMNETGNTPGQSWLWLFSLFYQVPPFSSADNADLVVVLIMGVLTVLLALLPFIPGLRTFPRWIPLHKLVWRDYYRAAGGARTEQHATSPDRREQSVLGSPDADLPARTAP
ncbi:hypothetical protein [Microbacterium rhizosphaerae]|uniref:Uncharacterized protein n=1 Tax=Microbacterium rhizosphaerae TaxID=1678237 RepID=A0ABZ0SM23_9MICO|nr:hypothetical protein [Microbacterium rhizosphaerae]WPR88276.1 hypothetical protein SM116_10830 [Microbacterium rhizosphaerae]